LVNPPLVLTSTAFIPAEHPSGTLQQIGPCVFFYR
jgi:hypothetical protein